MVSQHRRTRSGDGTEMSRVCRFRLSVHGVDADCRHHQGGAAVVVLGRWRRAGTPRRTAGRARSAGACRAWPEMRSGLGRPGGLTRATFLPAGRDLRWIGAQASSGLRVCAFEVGFAGRGAQVGLLSLGCAGTGRRRPLHAPPRAAMRSRRSAQGARHPARSGQGGLRTHCAPRPVARPIVAGAPGGGRSASLHGPRR